MLERRRKFFLIDSDKHLPLQKCLYQERAHQFSINYDLVNLQKYHSLDTLWLQYVSKISCTFFNKITKSQQNQNKTATKSWFCLTKILISLLFCCVFVAVLLCFCCVFVLILLLFCCSFVLKTYNLFLRRTVVWYVPLEFAQHSSYNYSERQCKQHKNSYRKSHLPEMHQIKCIFFHYFCNVKNPLDKRTKRKNTLNQYYTLIFFR